MIRGRVRDGRPVVDVTLRLSDRPGLALEFVVDTGFRGALALPPQAVEALGLPFVTDLPTLPASGVPHQADPYLASIEWDGEGMVVPLVATGTYPLLGTLLLRGRRLTVDFEEGGPVVIEPLPHPPGSA